MSELKPEELVVGEVVGFEEYGAILKLEDYDKDAFLHISEIQLKRGERMESKLKLRSKIVVRVLREDKKSNKVFVSLKQISEEEAKSKMRMWKERKNAVSMVQKVIEDKIDDKSFLTRVEKKAVEKYGSLGNALRVALEEGPKTLVRIGVPAELCGEILTLARKELIKKETRRTKRIKMLFTKPNGVDLLKRVVADASAPADGIYVVVRSQAPPLYYVTAYGTDPKKTSSRLDEVADEIVKNALSLGGYAEILD
jgi:translation initiation factor 2 alpha subunit (eIF-2alpha)